MMPKLNGEFGVLTRDELFDRELTPVQRKMLQILSDGEPHRATELHTCLMDELGALSNVTVPVSMLRRRLRWIGYNIATERWQDEVWYRIVKAPTN